MEGDRPSAEMRAILERLAVEDAGVRDPTTLPPAEGRALAARLNRRWNVDLPAMAEVIDAYRRRPIGAPASAAEAQAAGA